jgi:hypothetical protein
MVALSSVSSKPLQGAAQVGGAQQQAVAPHATLATGRNEVKGNPNTGAVAGDQPSVLEIFAEMVQQEAGGETGGLEDGQVLEEQPHSAQGNAVEANAPATLTHPTVETQANTWSKQGLCGGGSHRCRQGGHQS